MGSHRCGDNVNDGTSTDGACHAIGSVYGCLEGLDCNQLAHCVRRIPEHQGYGMPPTSVSLAAGVVILLFAAMICWATKRGIQERCAPRSLDEENYSEEALLHDLTPDSGAVLTHDANDTLALDGELHGEDHKLTGLGYSMTPHRKVMSWCGWFDKHCCSERLWCVAKWTVWLTVSVAAIVAVGAAMFYPLPPSYTICNQAVNWKSTFQGMRQLGVRGDVTLLISFYNPNRLTANIDNALAKFSWGNDYVGRWELEKGLTLVSSAGDVVDYQMTIKFEPTLYNAYEMYQAYTYKHNLTLGMDLHISGHLSLGRWVLHSFDSYYMPTQINCNAPSNRKWCKCKSWTKPG